MASHDQPAKDAELGQRIWWLEAEKAAWEQELRTQLAEEREKIQAAETTAAELQQQLWRYEHERTAWQHEHTSRWNEQLDRERHKRRQAEAAQQTLAEKVQEREAVTLQLKAALSAAEKTRRLAQQTAERYQHMAQEYRGSVRYQLGDALLSALRPSRHTLRLPLTLFGLLRTGLANVKARQSRGRPLQPLVVPASDGARRKAPPPAPAPSPPPETPAPAVAASQIPPALSSERRDSQQVLVGSILDEFTAACFQPECALLSFRPDNWQAVLEQQPPQAVFVESAWKGNQGSWQYRVAKYAKNMGDELLDLLAWTTQKNIPSLFWNKEDPVHFDRFIDKAKLFDSIFTTDADCIEAYRRAVGHGRVFALPFAAQPQIHNPLVEHIRVHPVCFAGTYYGGSFADRRQDMEHLLRPALDFGLHIYDRQYGVVGADAAQFRFPDIYQPAIKGRLDYDDMVKAYRKYKVFLNVNSVKTSPTMFSRRVFELLACGTPVISTYSKGIEELLGTDLVLLTESETQTKRHLQKLLDDQDYWCRLSVRGMRKVLEEHTYQHRFGCMLDRAGIDRPEPKPPVFTVMATAGDGPALRSLQTMLQRQVYPHFEVVLLYAPSIGQAELQQLDRALPQTSVQCYPLASEAASDDGFRAVGGDYLCVFCSQDYYGANYLRDYALATHYAPCFYLGKRSHFVEGAGAEMLRHAGYEFQLVARVPTATLAVHTSKLTKPLFRQLLQEADFETAGKEILSLDRYNYMRTEQGGALPLERGRLVEV